MDTENDAPYERVLKRVLADIRDGTYPPGGRLPSASAIAEATGVSRATVTRAMARIRWVGLVVGPAGGLVRVVSEPRRTAALAIVDEAERVRRMPE